MTGSATRDSINRQAARWAARNATSDRSDTDNAEFEAWLAADRRHTGAYLRAQASYYALEEAVLASPVQTASNDDEPLDGSARPLFSRRHIIGFGSAVAACTIAAAFALPALRAPTLPSPQTMQLADGSSALLGKGGKIIAEMAGKTRQIILTHGEATFHVAKDSTRPFIVHSGEIYAQATGTIYSVRRVGEKGGAVRVMEGSVRVWAEGARGKAVMLHAGDALTLAPALPAKAPPPIAQSFWFDDTPVSEAAEQFNRVNDTHIIIATPAIGKVTIMGRFRPDRPDEFAKAVAALTNAQVAKREGALVIEKK